MPICGGFGLVLPVFSWASGYLCRDAGAPRVSQTEYRVTQTACIRRGPITRIPTEMVMQLGMGEVAQGIQTMETMAVLEATVVGIMVQPILKPQWSQCKLITLLAHVGQKWAPFYPNFLYLKGISAPRTWYQSCYPVGRVGQASKTVF